MESVRTILISALFFTMFFKSSHSSKATCPTKADEAEGYNFQLDFSLQDMCNFDPSALFHGYNESLPSNKGSSNSSSKYSSCDGDHEYSCMSSEVSCCLGNTRICLPADSDTSACKNGKAILATHDTLCTAESAKEKLKGYYALALFRGASNEDLTNIRMTPVKVNFNSASNSLDVNLHLYGYHFMHDKENGDFAMRSFLDIDISGLAVGLGQVPGAGKGNGDLTKSQPITLNKVSV